MDYLYMIQTIPHIIDYHMYAILLDERSVSPYFGNIVLLFFLRFHPSLSFVHRSPAATYNKTQNTYFVFIFILFDLCICCVVLKLTKTGAPGTFLCVCVRVRLTTISNQNRLTPSIHSYFMLFALAWYVCSFERCVFCSFNKSFIISEDCSFFGYLIASLFCKNLFSRAAAAFLMYRSFLSVFIRFSFHIGGKKTICY